VLPPNDDFRVIDDVLAREDFVALWKDVQRLRFDLPSGEWNKVWAMTDALPMASGAFRWARRPVGHGMDRIAEKFIEAIRQSQLYGHEGDDWVDVGFRVYLHARGSRLSFHSDWPEYVGAGVYYVHPRWSASWGGELFFPEMPPLEEWGPLPLDGPISKPGMDECLNRLGTGRYVAPKPNRMVLIRGGAWHSTNSIDPSAGNNLRCSIAAFVLRKDGGSENEGEVVIGD
jgi:hypothetical protein